jgi:hypothetical protein
MTAEPPCMECATAGMAGFCPHRPAPATQADIDRQVTFCPSCFADEDGGSWDHQAMAGYCLNCGSASTITLAKWAVNEIRRNAAWVGSRYYPDDETKARHRELLALRKAIGRWPGRTVTAMEDDPGGWRLRQAGESKDDGFVWIETTVAREGDETPEQAIARTADRLPWVEAKS